jgi:hypothetical protein
VSQRCEEEKHDAGESRVENEGARSIPQRERRHKCFQ